VGAKPITFLSDYGQADEFAGVCRAVIARLAPEVTVIDLTHGVRRHSIEEGAALLAKALPYAPAGVHLAVVDPGVGSPRRAVAVQVTQEDRILVGPDNGLLWPAVERLGGAVAAVDVSLSPFRLEPVSATFHGRDIFAPVAAHLARGAELADAGEPLDPDELEVVDLPEPHAEEGLLVTHALVIDRFGNVGLDVDHDDTAGTGITLGSTVEIEAAGERYLATYAQTFADVRPGELIVYEDAYRTLALAINRGDAAGTLGLQPDAEVRLRPR
jgi:S-adenosyl-L-methionine hydrolase (adenosine-forming)